MVPIVVTTRMRTVTLPRRQAAQVDRRGDAVGDETLTRLPSTVTRAERTVVPTGTRSRMRNLRRLTHAGRARKDSRAWSSLRWSRWNASASTTPSVTLKKVPPAAPR